MAEAFLHLPGFTQPTSLVWLHGTAHPLPRPLSTAFGWGAQPPGSATGREHAEQEDYIFLVEHRDPSAWQRN